MDAQQALNDALVMRAAQRRRWLAWRAGVGGTTAAATSGGSVEAAAAAAPGAFVTLAAPHGPVETEVKKSKFIAFAWPCATAEDAAALIAGASEPSASHNCWAWKVGQQYRSSDDGEPGGTAGRPILSAIEGEGLDSVAVLVVRHFGGVKLGAGGLVRAYGGAARECLRGAPRRAVTPRVRLRMQVPYELLGAIYPLLDQHCAAKEGEDYDAAAGVSLLVGVEAARAPALAAAVVDATSGRVAAVPAEGSLGGSPVHISPGLSKAAAFEEDFLFNAPQELLCPLTLSPFIDPVLTTAGHVYERAAITAHMELSNLDPMSRQPLLNKSLTPVYVLRSRALEYRETVAKACIQRLCGSVGLVHEPMRYLRRAVELIADTGSHVQGLSQETVEYVLTHPSNAYDRIALQMFAQGLYQAGYRDKAAAIYSSLLLEDADRVQQAELLRRCLSCWTDDAAGGAPEDDFVYQKLVSLFEGRPGALSWEELVELAQHAQLGNRFVLRLCEQLLFRTLPSTAGGGDDALALAGGTGGQEKRLLLKYVHVLTDSLQRRQSDVDRRLAELERWRRQKGGGGGGGGGALVAHGSASGLSDDGGGRGGPLQLSRWLRRPAVVAPAMLLVALLPHDHPAARALRALPLLALLPPATAP
ncbi:IMPACT family member in pol 5 region [Micractinium conductrix]|uniref:IMPACT family member in pol 5 region n=1 Tax=Micractinium conductrix TaxID=554055 RepID=A0A2P6V3Q9_9CHLO|nr:IMPACT family member in pol 5 region [Micractinium conductrix]|eukprot:PSC68729.1 IMPACT family member in pol 5 region [Micractinium conductrix]